MRALMPESVPAFAAGGAPETSCIADGAKPNMRFDVRVRCAASANPAEWAAVDSDTPRMTRFQM